MSIRKLNLLVIILILILFILSNSSLSNTCPPHSVSDCTPKRTPRPAPLIFPAARGGTGEKISVFKDKTYDPNLSVQFEKSFVHPWG